MRDIRKHRTDNRRVSSAWWVPQTIPRGDLGKVSERKRELQRTERDQSRRDERPGVLTGVFTFYRMTSLPLLKADLRSRCSTFKKADTQVLADESTGKSGSTATVALLHSLDLPHSFPYYAASLISLTVAHLGDTTCLLATSSQGRARRLTEPHHGDSRVEGERLRTSGTGIVTDSFGESRWGGTLANTRGIGDREFKSLGVIGEPEVTKRVLKGESSSLTRSGV